MALPGVKIITVFGKYKVWTQKIGSGDIKLLLLHGGPAGSHEYLEDIATRLSNAGIEVYLYEQLGSYFSDQPKIIQEDSLWKMNMRVNEVEQVRKALGLEKFYLYGHSWGAALGLAYTHQYPQYVLGYIFSNMNVNYSLVSPRIDFTHKQIDSLLKDDHEAIAMAKEKHPWTKSKHDKVFYRYYVLRTKEIPDCILRTKKHGNEDLCDLIYRNMIASQDYYSRLVEIKTPILLVGSKYDYCVNENDLINFSSKLKDCRLRFLRNAGHFAMFDSPEEYDSYILNFLNEIEGRKKE